MVIEIERRQRKWEAERQRQMKERLERRKARLSRLFSRSSSREQVGLILALRIFENRAYKNYSLNMKNADFHENSGRL